MVQQSTATRTSSTKRSKSADKYLATFFFVLMQRALARLSQGTGGPQREAVAAAYDVHRLLTEATNHLVSEFSSQSQSGKEQIEWVLKHLFGFVDGYPRSPASVARMLGAGTSEQSVCTMETEAFSSLAQLSDNLIVKMREEWFRQHPCPDCKAKVGEVHTAGCKGEECPFCHEFLSQCPCVYKHLKIKWGGKTAKEWRALQKACGQSFNVRRHARSLTTKEEREWASIVLKRGCIPYGSEQHFQ